jgi:prolyl-tRNA synthetase
VVFRRDTYEKQEVALSDLAEKLPLLLEDIQENMFAIAAKFRDERITVVSNLEELKKATENGFAKTMWCGERACEDQIKAEMSVTSRNLPFDQEPVGHSCVCCGEKADKVIYFAKAY